MMKVTISSLFIFSLRTTSQAFSVKPSVVGKVRPNVSFQNIRTRIFAETDEKSGLFSEDVKQEARDVLEKVGWARPMQGEGEMTSEDPFVQQINAGIQRDFGVDLDDLLNPAKVGGIPSGQAILFLQLFVSLPMTVLVSPGCQFGTGFI